MNVDLIEKITVAFHNENYFFHKNRIFNDNIAPIPRDKKIKLDEMQIQLNSQQSIFFNDIFIWSKDEYAFNYFFPEILVYCIKHDFEDNQVMRCLMSCLVPDFDYFSYHSYFKELFYFSTEQRNILIEFIEMCLKNNDFLYKKSCQYAKNSLFWLNEKDNLLKDIDLAFDMPFVLTESTEIVYEKNNSDVQYLVDKLKNVHWRDFIKDATLFNNYDYVLLKNKAFWYFMPACLHVILDDVIKYQCIDLTQSILSSLCSATDDSSKSKFSYFTDSQKKVIVRFLLLMSNRDFSDEEEQKKISDSLNCFWYQVQ